MWNTLSEFTEWYIKEGFPIKPPTTDPIYVTDHTYSAIVFRQGRYQVELYMLAPNWVTPNHGHPGVESKIIFLNGTIYGTRNNETLPDAMEYTDLANPDGTNVAFGNYLSFDSDDYHTVGAGHKGGLVAICQHWEEGLTMSSQSVHYTGEPIGPEHSKYINI